MYCKRCGRNIINDDDFGKNDDGTLNKDFCSDCFKNGKFVEEYFKNNKDVDIFSGLMPSSDSSILSLSEGSSDISPTFIDFKAEKED